MTDSDYDPSEAASSASPLISVVIPVYNVSAYLAECLDSVLGQPFQAIEVVAVDTGSTDGSAAILAGRTAEDARLRVLTMTPPAPDHSPLGPGRARNAGIQAAGGEYLWFVDGDDAVVPERVAEIADRLVSERPDVLLIGHLDVYPDGTEREGLGLDLLRHLDKPVVTLAQEPRLVEMRLPSWNKIVRRQFLRSTGTGFLDEWPHEDIPLSCAVLTQARSIAVVGQPCYRYRDGRPGSAMTDGSARRHFTVFAAWDQALSAAHDLRADGDPAVTPGVYRALFERAIWHCTSLLDKDLVVGTRLRRRFFTQLHQLYQQHAPTDYRPPSTFRGLKFRLVAANGRLLYAALAEPNKLRVRLASARGRRQA